jgi:hypothetical protein
MDQGINLPFSSAGHADITYGLPTFADGWKGLVITGSSTAALRSNNGGRLLLNVKCVHDPAGVDTGKDHLIGLNLWHNDADTKKRAEDELATIMRAIFGSDRQINSTSELYNMPFLAKAVTQTPAATQQYPNPQPQTNWRGYATQAGLGVGVDGPNGRLGGGNAAGGAPAGFNGGAPQGAPQGFPQQGQPQGGPPQGGAANWGQPGQQPQQQPNQQPNGGGWGNNGAPSTGGASPQQNAQPNGPQGGWNGGGAPTQSPSDNGGGGWGPQGGAPQGQPQQPQQPQNGGGWGGPPQGQPGPGPQGWG